MSGDAGTPAVGFLAQVDTLLYDLMNYDGTGEAWIDSDDIETKEVLKLKEIIDHMESGKATFATIVPMFIRNTHVCLDRMYDDIKALSSRMKKI